MNRKQLQAGQRVELAPGTAARLHGDLFGTLTMRGLKYSYVYLHRSHQHVAVRHAAILRVVDPYDCTLVEFEKDSS